MTSEEIRGALIKVLVEIQQQSGRSVPDIHDDIRPIGDLEGFDSLNAEEAITMLSAQLGCELESDLFVSEGRSRALRTKEITDRLYKAICTKKERGTHE